MMNKIKDITWFVPYSISYSDEEYRKILEDAKKLIEKSLGLK